MAFDFSIQQALLAAEPGGPRTVAKSEGFPFAWEEAARLMVVRFGAKPADTAVSASLFALPVGKTHAAVVQVGDLPSGALGFHFLILGQPLYRALGDPFAIAERFPADWSSRGEMPVLAWPAEPLPPRRVEDLDAGVGIAARGLPVGVGAVGGIHGGDSTRPRCWPPGV